MTLHDLAGAVLIVTWMSIGLIGVVAILDQSVVTGRWIADLTIVAGVTAVCSGWWWTS